jgi:FkbM family methyltransferase
MRLGRPIVENHQMRAAIRRLVSPVRRYPALFVALRELFHPGRALYQHLHFIGPIKVQVSDRASFMINHYGYQVENDLFWTGFGRGWEGAELRLWRALVRSAEFIADVGANTGVYSLAAGAVNPCARIVAIEPVSRIYERLTANLALNHFNIRALQIAASDADGEAILFDTEGEPGYSASLDASMLEGYEIIRVPIRAACLDSVFAELGWPRVDLLKIDVEKHEPAVLAGMQRHLAKDRPTLLIEILNREIGAAILKSVGGNGYRCFAIDEQRGLIEAPALDRSGVRNYLLCAEERWRSFGEDLMNEIQGANKPGGWLPTST